MVNTAALILILITHLGTTNITSFPSRLGTVIETEDIIESVGSQFLDDAISSSEVHSHIVASAIRNEVENLTELEGIGVIVDLREAVKNRAGQ